MNRALKPRQRKFVDNIEAGTMSLVDAYVEAGYKDSRSKYSGASELLRKPNIVDELDRRLFNRKRMAEQRFGNMIDGSTNVYVRILKLDPKDDPKLMELQRKVAVDVFDRGGLKPPENIDHTGKMVVQFVGLPEGIFDDDGSDTDAAGTSESD
jgi:hypothetical protein